MLLIGSSNVKGVHETRLSASLNIAKFVKYTSDETKDFVKDYNEPPRPDLVVIHPFTNNLKTITPQNCVQSLETLIVDIQHKWPNTEIIVSLATPRKDNLKLHTNGQIINALIKEKIISNPTKISFCDQSNLLIKGNPCEDMLTEDKYHLSSYGLSFYASNLKKAMHSTLGLPLHVHNQKKIDLVQGVREQVEVEGVGCKNILHSPDLYYKLQVP